MITCKSCRAEHPPNKIYCNECGAWLGEGPAPKGTRRLTSQLAAAAAGAPRQPPLPLHLRSPDGTKHLEPILDGELVIGRITPDLSGGRADVDLEPLGGGERGVSRRHARMVRVGEQLLLEDLGSLNGTRVAGAILAPGRPQVIRPGDELQFGSIILRIDWKNG